MYIYNTFLPKLTDGNGKLDLENTIKCGMTFNTVSPFYIRENSKGRYNLETSTISSTDIVVGYSKKTNKVYLRELINKNGEFSFFNSRTYCHNLDNFLASLGILNRRVDNFKMADETFNFYKNCKSIVFGKHYVKNDKVAQYTLNFIETLVNNPLIVRDYKPEFRWYGYQIDYSKELQTFKKRFKLEEIYF